MQENYYNSDDDEEEIDVKELFTAVFNRLPFIALCTAFCLVVALIYVFVATPIYETQTTILVSPLNTSSSMEGLLGGVGSLGGTKTIDTELALLNSVKVRQLALDQLDLAKYSTEKVDYTELEPKDLKDMYEVNQDKSTRNVVITVKHSNPEFATDLANALAKAFQMLLSDITKESTRSQMVTISNQIPIAEAQLTDSLDKLAAFRSENGTDQMAAKTTVLTAKIAAIQMQRTPMQLQQNEALETLTKEDLTVTPAIESKLERYYKAAKEFMLYQGVEAVGSSGTANNTEDVNAARLYALQSQMNAVNQDIITEVSRTTKDPAKAKNIADYLCTSERLNILDEIEQLYTDELASYQVIQGRLKELESNITVNQSLVLSLKNMLEEARVVDSSSQSNVSIVDVAPIPEKPVSPKKTLICLVAIVGGAFLGAAYVVAETLLDNTVKSEDDVTKAYGNPITSIGWIPYQKVSAEDEKNKKQLRLVALSQEGNYIQERYRLLATNLEFLAGEDCKVLVVNSSDIGEGKSSVCSNLAATLAINGKKVLVIDGDLRRPELERKFGIARCKTGLTDIMIDKVPYQDCIVKPVQKLENLHFLPAGHSSRNPNIVFGSKLFAELIKELRGIYDYVFIDCPPVSYGSDFSIIAKNIDAYMFVIRAGFATKEQVRDLNKAKDFVQAKLLGYVFYGLLEEHGGYGYGSYGKYGYGDDKKKKKRFSLRRKVNYKKLHKQELEARQKTSHIYGTYKAPLAFQDGMEHAFGHLTESDIMRGDLETEDKN